MKITQDMITLAKKADVKKVFDKIHLTKEEIAEENALCGFLISIERELGKKHMTRYALAKKAGLKPQVVSRVFNNGENAEFATLSKMARGVNKRLVLKLV